MTTFGSSLSYGHQYSTSCYYCPLMSCADGCDGFPSCNARLTIVPPDSSVQHCRVKLNFAPLVGPRHQGGARGGRAPAKMLRAPAKITGLIMFHLGCQIMFLVKIEKDHACIHSWFVSNDSWSFLDRFLWCYLKCIVWVLIVSFLGSIDARTWRGYRLYGPRPPDGPNWQFQSGDGVAFVMIWACMVRVKAV